MPSNQQRDGAVAKNVRDRSQVRFSKGGMGRGRVDLNTMNQLRFLLPGMDSRFCPLYRLRYALVSEPNCYY
jgi:hypothetical protein